MGDALQGTARVPSPPPTLSPTAPPTVASPLFLVPVAERVQPCRSPAPRRGGGTRRVQSVREEGRDVSSQYGRRDEPCPVSTGGGTRRVPCCSPGASVRTKVPQATARPAADRSPFAVCFINMLVLHACLLVIHFSARRRRCLARATSRARSPCLTRRWGAHPRPPSRPPCAPSPSLIAVSKQIARSRVGAWHGRGCAGCKVTRTRRVRLVRGEGRGVSD